MRLDHIGRYEIQRRLGTGGMGSLFLARDPVLDRLVAIKLLKDDYQDDQELRERFLREARSVARLRHRNIVLVFDVGEDEGRQFMAMEYLSGQTLSKLLAQQPPLPLAQRVSLGEQLCAGLAHAHGAGIVHRDIKPANAMLDAEGVLKILDFGIAHLADSGITRDGMMMGSVNYMSPEQITGQRIDHRTDIFAAGAVLYELVSLKQAFPGGFDSGVLNRILHEGHTPLLQVMPGVNPGLAQIIDRALDRIPEKRYQDIEVMRRDLERVRRHLPEGLGTGEHSLDETVVVVRPSPPSGRGSSPPSARARREDTDRRKDKDSASQRFGAIRRQQAEHHLLVSRTALEQGDYETALEAAERAVAIDPDYQDAFDLMERAKATLEAAAIREGLNEAERLLADGHLEEAEAHIDRALGTDPATAKDVYTRARKLADQLAAIRERHRQIESALTRARTSLDSQRFDTALRTIGELLTLDPGNAEARELQAKATTAIAAQRERETRRRQAHERIELARTLTSNHRFTEAADTLAAISPPTDTVRKAIAEVAAFIEEQKREAARQARLATLQRQIDAGDFEQAITEIDRIAVDERSGELRALRITAENGIRARMQLERKRIELTRVMTTARELCAADDFQGARDLVTEGFRLGGDEATLTEISDEITRAEAAAEQQRLQDVRDKTAARKVEAARQMSARDVRSAIVFLERDDSGHPAIADVLRELRAEVNRQEQVARDRAESERVQQEQAAVRAREDAERARADAERRARDESDRRVREDAERRAREEADRRAREESERRAREESERREREESERRERERQTRLAAEAEARQREEQERHERERREREKREREQHEREQRERERQARLAAEAEARRQQELQEDVAAETVLVRDRGHQAQAPASPIPESTGETIVARPAPAPPAPTLKPTPAPPVSKKPNVALLGGIAALVVAGIVAALFLRGGTTVAPPPTVTTTVTPATVTPTTVAPNPPPQPQSPPSAPPAPTQPNEVAALIQRTQVLLKQGNLGGAAREIDDGTSRAPQDATLQSLAQSVFQTASAQAAQAKTDADRANASSRPAYQEAVTHLKAADASRTARRVRQAVDEYAAAARLFGDAARAPQIAQLTTIGTTSIPIAEPPPPPRPQAPTVQSSVATTSIPPTTSIVPTIDQDTVERVLTAYASASRTFNVNAIEQIYPKLPAQTRLRLDALRKNYNYCDYSFSNIRIVSSTPTEATIRVDGVESCKPKTAQRAIESRATQMMTLRKGASGAWTIDEVLGAQ